MKARIEFIYALSFAMLLGSISFAAEWGGVGPVAGGGGRLPTDPVSFSPNGLIESAGDGDFRFQTEAGTGGWIFRADGTTGMQLRNLADSNKGDLGVLSLDSYGGINLVSPAASAYLTFSYGDDTTLYHGAGAPSAALTSGSAYMRSDCGSGVPCMYNNTDGTALGWVPVMNGDLYSTGISIETSADTTITITAADTYYEVTSANFSVPSADPLNYWTNSAGGLTPNSGVDFGIYQIVAPLTFSAGNGDHIEFIIKTGATEIGHCHTQRDMATTAFGSSTLSCVIGVSSTDELTLWVKNDGTTDVIIGSATTWYIKR